MIIGHELIVNYFQHIIASQQPAHAYLFSGPVGVGKMTTARWIAQGLLCRESNTKPCLTCQSCLALTRGLHPDFYLLEPLAETAAISIDQIRQLQGQISKKAFYNSFKIIIINRAEDLNQEAGNAFLKVLEEPPGRAVFFLLGNNPRSVLPTIKSRCAEVKFSLVSQEQIVRNLADKFSDEQKNFIAKISQGKIGLALSLDGEKIKILIDEQKKLVRLIKAPPDEQLNYLASLNTAELMPVVESLTNLIRDILFCKLQISGMTYHYFRPELAKIAGQRTLAAITSALSRLLDLPRKLNQNINAQLLLQNVILNFNA